MNAQAGILNGQKMTKKDRILSLHEDGFEIAEIIEKTDASERYVYGVLSSAKTSNSASKKSSVDNQKDLKIEQLTEQIEEFSTELKKAQLRVRELSSVADNREHKIEQLTSQVNYFKTEQKSVQESVKELNSKIDQYESEIELKNEEIEQLEKRIQRTKRWDVGELITTHPNVKFVGVMTLIAMQAWVFASLWDQFFISLHSSVPFVLAYAAAVICEMGGLMKARQKLESDSMVDLKEMKKARNAWLTGFLVFQLGIEFSFLHLLEWVYVGFSQDLGMWLVGAAIPFSILLYYSMYLTAKNTRK